MMSFREMQHQTGADIATITQQSAKQTVDWKDFDNNVFASYCDSVFD